MANLDRAVDAIGPVEGPDVWTPEAMLARQDWLYVLSPEDVADVDAAVAAFIASGRELLEIDRDSFALPHFGERLQQIRHDILWGRGFVQMRGFPVHRYSRLQSAVAYMGIGAHLGDRMPSQNAKGHVLGHIYDIGQSKSNPNQRGPYSNERIPYHCDTCDIVGLLCLHPALEGGESKLSSSGAVFNRMLELRPDLVEELLKPNYRDRRGEVPPGKEPWYAIPIFNFHQGLFSASVEHTYSGSVARHFDHDPNSPTMREAEALLQETAEALHLDIDFEQGDMQFLHNHTIMHSRGGFRDHDDTAKRRHLLRLWLTCDDGRPVPACFYDRMGSIETLARPGGIVGPDTVLNCPLEPA